MHYKTVTPVHNYTHHGNKSINSLRHRYLIISLILLSWKSSINALCQIEVNCITIVNNQSINHSRSEPDKLP